MRKCEAYYAGGKKMFYHNRKFHPLRIGLWVILGIVAAAAFALVLGLVVMLLWNWLMPQLFGLSVIGYWQAWGLVLLSHILFKGGLHHAGHYDKGSYHDRNEWREKFRQRFEDAEHDPQ